MASLLSLDFTCLECCADEHADGSRWTIDIEYNDQLPRSAAEWFSHVSIDQKTCPECETQVDDEDVVNTIEEALYVPSSASSAQTTIIPQQVEYLRQRVSDNVERIARQGNWPPYITADSLLERIPDRDSKISPGFDAGIACALDLIPREKQSLSSKLHAAYTLEAVDQVRNECVDFTADSESTWWLAACSICEEGTTDVQPAFHQQILRFQSIAHNQEKRLLAAQEEYHRMTSSCAEYLTPAGYKGPAVAYGQADGCQQGAYIAGYDVAVMWAEEYGIYFVGTPHETLYLEDFVWHDPSVNDHLGTSGPVHGSRQFVKASNTSELKRLLLAVGEKWPR